MCLINAAHEHFITQTGKKPKTALKNFMGLGGPRKTNTHYIFSFTHINIKKHNTSRLLSGVTKLKKIFTQKELLKNSL